MPTFSVVIPCYRAGATIITALQSVRLQSCGDFEIIVVDDGCPQRSGSIAEAIGDPRIRVLYQPNAGPSAARNAGARAARGELVAFLDSDDQWRPDCLARHRAAFAANPALGISFARVRFCDASLAWGGRLSGITGRLRLADALGDNPTCTSSNLVVRRDLLIASGGFDPALHYAEDQDFVARVLAAGEWQVIGLNAALVDYRMSGGGLSADLHRMRDGWMSMLARLRTIAPADIARAEPAAAACFHRYLARRALRTGQPAALALDFLRQAVSASPLALLRHQPHRSAMTALGVLAALAMPAPLIRPLISR